MKPTLPRTLKIGLWLLLALPLIYVGAKAAQPAGFAAVRLREQLLAYAALQAMWLLWMLNRLPAAPNATRALIAGTPAWVGALANTVLAGALLWARLAAPKTLALAGLTEFGIASPYLLAVFALATLAALAVRAVPAGQPLGQTWRAWAAMPLDWHDDLFSPRAAAIAVWVLFAVGVAIRLVNLGGFPPYPDEDNHTSTALELMRTGTTTYTRSLLTVTLPVLVSFKLLGVSWFAARLPMVLLSMASVWPLYWLASRVNRSVGVLAAFLFAISPWMITAGRSARDYAIIPFFVYLSAWLLLKMLEPGSGGFLPAMRARWKLLAALLVLAVYIMAIDFRSLLNTAMINYASAAILAGLMYAVGHQTFSLRRKIAIAGFILAAGVVGGYTWFITDLSRVAGKGFDPQWMFLEAFFTDPNQNWLRWSWLNGLFVVLFAFFAAKSILSVVADARGHVPLLMAGSLLGATLVLTFLAFRGSFPARMRYAVLMANYYLPLFAIAIWWLARQLYKRLGGQKRALWAGTLLVFGLLFINAPSIATIWAYQGGARFVITGNNHFRSDEAYAYLVGAYPGGLPILAGPFSYVDEMNGYRLENPVYLHFNRLFRDEKKTLADVVAANPNGWAVLYPDSYPLDNGFELADFSLGGASFTYHGRFGDADIWSWQTP